MFTRAPEKTEAVALSQCPSVCDDLPAWTSGRAAPQRQGSHQPPPKLQSPAPNHSNNLVFIDHQKSTFDGPQAMGDDLPRRVHLKARALPMFQKLRTQHRVWL